MDKDIIQGFIGNVIRVDRGGPESKIGMLLGASDDHIVLLTEDDGVVYYNNQHIKSFTGNMKEPMEFNIEVPEDFQWIKADNLQDLFTSLRLKWITINRGGPEKLEGILTQVDKDFIYLVNSQEMVRLSLFHIKSISYGLKIEKTKQEESNEQQSVQTTEISNNDSQNKKKRNKNSKKKTSQKTTVEDTEGAEGALAYPLSTIESSQTTAVEDAESDLSIPIATEESSQTTAVADPENEIAVLLTILERFLRNFYKTNQN
jgi:spore coat protein B